MTTKADKLDAARAAVQPHIDALTDDMRPIIDRIENTGMMAGTTQHNYAGYMSALADLCPDNDPRMLFIIASAMIAAGGNRAGINAAIGINTGRESNL